MAPRGKLRSNRQFNPGYPGLLLHNIVDRNTYAYRGFYVDAARAVDFVQARPEVDASRDRRPRQSSQGGALTIVTAALRPDAITAAAAGAPYLCGFHGRAALTHSYPYEEINEYLRLYPEREPAVRETLDYFDGDQLRAARPLPDAGLHRPGGRRLPAGDRLRAVRRADAARRSFTPTPRCGHDAGRYWMMPKVQAFLAEHLKPAATGQRAEPTVG